MKRRDFIQVMLPIAGLPIVWPMWSFSKPLRKLGKSNYPVNFPDDGRVLVLVQCAGGNDGLNTIIPYKNDIYYNERPQLAIPESETIQIANGLDLGFHNLWVKSNLAVPANLRRLEDSIILDSNPWLH